MNKDLEETLDGFRKVHLTGGQRWRAERMHPYRSLELYGAFERDIALSLVKDHLEGQPSEIRMIKASEFPMPDELRANMEKKHPGHSERYWTGQHPDEALIPGIPEPVNYCHDCQSDVNQFKDRYFVFLKESGGS